MDGGSHVQECLINAEFFAVWCIMGEKFHHISGTLDIIIKAGRDDSQLRAFFQSLGKGFAGGYAIFFGRCGLGQNDSVAAGGIPAHCRGNGP